MFIFSQQIFIVFVRNIYVFPQFTSKNQISFIQKSWNLFWNTNHESILSMKKFNCFHVPFQPKIVNFMYFLLITLVNCGNQFIFLIPIRLRVIYWAMCNYSYFCGVNWNCYWQSLSQRTELITFFKTIFLEIGLFFFSLFSFSF